MPLPNNLARLIAQWIPFVQINLGYAPSKSEMKQFLLGVGMSNQIEPSKGVWQTAFKRLEGMFGEDRKGKRDRAAMAKLIVSYSAQTANAKEGDIIDFTLIKN